MRHRVTQFFDLLELINSRLPILHHLLVNFASVPVYIRQGYG